MSDDDAWTPPNELDADELEELEDYVVGQILDRIEAEPAFLARSIAVLDESDVEPEVDEEIAELESDPELLQDMLRISRITWDEPGPDVVRLLLLYTVDRVAVRPDLGPSVADRVTIHWRYTRK